MSISIKNINDIYYILNKYYKKLKDYKKLLQIKDYNINFKDIITKKKDIETEFGYIVGLLEYKNYGKIINNIHNIIYDKEYYKILIKYYNNYYKIEKKDLDNYDIKYIDYIINIFKNKGLNLSNIKINKLSKYNNNIIILQHKILNNIIRFNIDDNNIDILYNCNNREKRYELIINQANNYKINKKNIYLLLNLKKKKANILGYKNYAELVLKDNMAKNIENVLKFLDQLKIKLLPRLKKDIDLLKELAKKDNINDMDERDIFYYINKISKIDSLHSNIYFKLEKIISGIFRLYKHLINYNFVEIKNNIYEIYIIDSITKIKKIIGYLYLDLLKDETKYTIAEIKIIVNKTDKLIPICQIKCNFIEDISFDELIIFFHEFGHCIQIISSDSKYNYNYPFNTDFLEVPSQLLEELCYTKNVLQLMTDKIITDEFILLLKKNRNILNTIETANQLILSYVDIKMHQIKPELLDLDILYNSIYKDIFGFDNIINSIYKIDHIYEGYDSQYYSYLWANVYSKDIYMTKFKNHECQNEIWNNYINKFLSKFDYENPNILYNNYINRDVDYNYFINDM